MAFGKIIEGSVLDCRRGPIEAALKRYDSQLYLKWNPKKKDGQGCWEVRRRPTRMMAVFEGFIPDAEGKHTIALYVMEHVESAMVHHILDADVLDWRIPERIKEMDTWGNKNWVADMEHKGEQWLVEQEKKNLEEFKYSVKQHKREFSEWADLVARGQNPGAVLNKLRPKS